MGTSEFDNRLMRTGSVPKTPTRGESSRRSVHQDGVDASALAAALHEASASPTTQSPQARKRPRTNIYNDR